MRQILLTASLVLSLGLAACADHSGTLIAFDSPTPPPIGSGDEGNITPQPLPETGNSETPAPGGSNGFVPGSGSGSQPVGGAGIGGAGGASLGGGNPPAGGSPVPEPGTMLLVGTGLAGAALMRRRRQQVEVQTEA